MKLLHRSTAILTCICFLLSTASCLVVHKDNGKRGWTKNTNNPHHPNTTNPGKGNKKGKR
jgi:hypothetical protein